MSFLASIAQGVWDNINANSANAKAKRAATTAYNREVDFYKHRFQWATEDAEKAGINPAVAIGAPGNTPNVAPANTAKANAPDIAQAVNEEKANDIAQQNADTQENATRGQNFLNFANGIKNLKETGLMDRNTAAKEMEAQANFMKAEAEARQVDTIINRINKMLPGELKGQALDLALKAQQNKLNSSEMKYLNSVGLTKTQMIAIGGKVADMLNSDIFNMLDMKNQRDINSARNNTIEQTFKRPTGKEYFNSKGKFQGAESYLY